MTLSLEQIPEFAVVGHPNEGKSSVVSTLTEDDDIGISPVPGETRVSGSYTVEIDGQAIIRFVDTPGFQVPRQTLAWFKAFDGPREELLPAFIRAHQEDPFFRDECELLSPVARGAGIIYVVDGSRPVRPDDVAEMEILRLTGRPRMAVINAKAGDRDYTDDWRREFGLHFNSVRVFNSNTADFGERIRMLESLKSIDQDWERALEQVIAALNRDWDRRNELACAQILHTLERCLTFTLSRKLTRDTDAEQIKIALGHAYPREIRGMEQEMFDQIRDLFRHRLYQVVLPDESLLHHDLFSKTTWELLGLTQVQLAAAGAVMGGSMGAVADVAAHGLSFGIFTALGGILGAGSAVWGGKRITGTTGIGRRLGGDRIQVGPCRDLQFLYILLDRALIYYRLILGRAHGRRDDTQTAVTTGKLGVSSQLSAGERKICARYFNSVIRPGKRKSQDARAPFRDLVTQLLERMVRP